MRCNGWFAIASALLALVLPGVASAQGGEAPGAPGASANWTTGNKQGLGTSVGTSSKVWYTLSGGALSEVYYPSGDTAQVRSLELAVTDGRTFLDRESQDTDQQVRLVDPRALVYEQINTAKSGRYRITKTYITDPRRSTVLIRVRFEPLRPGSYHVFVLYDPAINNSSRGDTASRTGAAGHVGLLTSQGDTHAALMSANGFERTSNGFVGTSDGWTDLQDNRQLDSDYDTATNGNVLQTGELRVRSHGRRSTTHTLALGFGDSDQAAEAAAEGSLRAGFDSRVAA
jgi:glucoamylase